MLGGCKTAAICAAAMSVLCSAGSALGDVISIGTSKDNTLYEDFQGSLSNGAGRHLFTGSTAGFAYRRGLVAFDVAGALPGGATILNVSLTLHMSQTISGDQLVSLHRVLADWGEGSSIAPGEEGGGGPAQPGDATWKHTFYNNQFWTNLGGDFDANASASTIIGATDGFYTWNSTSQLVADVQSWLDNPGTSFGWEIIGNESTPFTAKRFDTRENLIESFRPMLTIEYLPIPEPGVFALMTIGLGWMGGRRRRGLID